MAHCLVTGAAGFVGSTLLEELERRRIPAVGVSRSQHDGLIQIPTYGRAMEWAPLLDGVDTIVHLAGRVHVMKDRATDPLSEFREANVESTLHLARQAAKAGVKRFVFMSTIKVNGETTPPGRPFTADDIPAPVGPYAVSKAEAEKQLFQLGRETGMDIVVIRPPLVSGPGAKGNLATLARLAKLGLPSPFAAVRNQRSLVHVANLCSLICNVATYEGSLDGVFLVSDGQDISTADLYNRLLDEYNRRKVDFIIPEWVFRLALFIPAWKSVHEKIFTNLQVDIRKTKEILDYRPTPAEELTLASAAGSRMREQG